jgi:hypothetical protein
MYDFSALYICVRNRPIDEFWHRARLESATIASPGRTAAGGLCLNGWFSKTCQKRYEVARGLVAGRTSRQRVATASVATIVSLGSRIDVYEGIVFEVSAVCCRCRQDPGNVPGNFFFIGCTPRRRHQLEIQIQLQRLSKPWDDIRPIVGDRKLLLQFVRSAGWIVVVRVKPGRREIGRSYGYA